MVSAGLLTVHVAGMLVWPVPSPHVGRVGWGTGDEFQTGGHLHTGDKYQAATL